MKREQMEEQRRAAAAARQELKEDRKPKQTAAGPAPSMALRTQASLQRALSNDDDGMFWDYGQAAGLRAGVRSCPVSTMPWSCLFLLSTVVSFFSCLLSCPVCVPLLRHVNVDETWCSCLGRLQLTLPPGNINYVAMKAHAICASFPHVPCGPPLEACLELWVQHVYTTAHPAVVGPLCAMALPQQDMAEGW